MTTMIVSPPLVREFIVYACPTGTLEQALMAYYDAARAECGPNTAHRYMPHCTLTGFFHDELASVPVYVDALQQALVACAPWRAEASQTGSDAIRIVKMCFMAEFHFLQIESPWLQQLVTHFAGAVNSSTRRDALRLKDWLHLSLVYGFRPEHHAQLVQLACRLVDMTAPVVWELRLYERRAGDEWITHAAWPLS